MAPLRNRPGHKRRRVKPETQGVSSEMHTLAGSDIKTYAAIALPDTLAKPMLTRYARAVERLKPAKRATLSPNRNRITVTVPDQTPNPEIVGRKLFASLDGPVDAHVEELRSVSNEVRGMSARLGELNTSMETALDRLDRALKR